MTNMTVRVHSEPLKDVIKDLFLHMEMRDNVPVELGAQLESKSLDIHNVIADLYGRRWCQAFLLIAIPSRLGQMIPEN